MNNLINAVKKAMPPKGNLRRYRVGILYNGNPKLVEALLALGHRTVIFSEQFRPLYKISRAFQKTNRSQLFDTTVMIESSLDAIPIRHESLDVLILSNGVICRGMPPRQRLSGLQRLVKPGGVIIWPERISDGVLGKLAKMRYPLSTRVLGPLPRRRICSLSMAAGLRDIGQIVVRERAIPFAVTFGKGGKYSYLNTI